MQTTVHRNGTKPSAYPFIVSSFQRAKEQKHPVAPYLRRNKLPEPLIF